MVPRVRFARTATLACVTLVVACNALTGVGELTAEGGDSTIASADAGGGAADAGANVDRDALGGGDGNGNGDPDAAIVVDDDGGGDAGGDGDGGPPLGFCASLAPGTADVCTDFDDGVFPGPWTIFATAPATAATITTSGFFRSSPRAVQFATPGGNAAASYLHKTAANAVTTEIVLHYAFRYDAIRSNADNETSTIRLGASGGNHYESQLELLPNGDLNWEEESPLSDGTIPEVNVPLGVNVPPGQWRNITITVAIAQTASTITWQVEGSAAVTKSANAHLYKAAPELIVGDNNTTTVAQSMTFDDVYYRVK